LKFSAGVIQAGFARTATSWTRPSYSCRAPARSWRAASFLDDDQVGAGYALIQKHREANLYRMKIRSQFLDVANSCPDVSPCLFLLYLGTGRETVCVLEVDDREPFRSRPSTSTERNGRRSFSGALSPTGSSTERRNNSDSPTIAATGQELKAVSHGKASRGDAGGTREDSSLFCTPDSVV
jgi:hypothetical protein